VTVFALGMDVMGAGSSIQSSPIQSFTLSPGIRGPFSADVQNGTSFAAPNVAGIMAIAIGRLGQMSPPDLFKGVKKHADAVVWGQLRNSGTTYASIFIS
jgi:hypothetical protein